MNKLIKPYFFALSLLCLLTSGGAQALNYIDSYGYYDGYNYSYDDQLYDDDWYYDSYSYGDAWSDPEYNYNYDWVEDEYQWEEDDLTFDDEPLQPEMN